MNAQMIIRFANANYGRKVKNVDIQVTISQALYDAIFNNIGQCNVGSLLREKEEIHNVARQQVYANKPRGFRIGYSTCVPCAN